MRRIFLVIILALGMGSGPVCAGPGPQDASKDLLSRLTQVSQVRSIEIHDDWMGLWEFGPLKRQYLLKPAGERFEGKIIFSLGGGPLTKTKEETLSIPKKVIVDFLGLLGRSLLEKGDYKPKIEHTDDYPSVRIVVEGEAGRMEFYSQSQGEFAVPWGAALGTEKFVVNVKNPGEALALLQPYVKEDSLRAFMDEVRAQNRHR